MMDSMIVINIDDRDLMMVWEVMDYKISMEIVIILKGEQEREN